MKKNTFISAAMTAAMLLTVSCTKPCEKCSDTATPSTLTLSLLSSATKSAVVTTNDEDNTINTLDIFIFRNTDPTSADYQKLDTYRHFEPSDLSDITISTTTGPKTICVIANDHANTFDGVTDLTSFRTLIADLKGEKLSSFTMYGEVNETLDISTKVEMTVQRFVSKVGISSIKTQFSGTPYAGYTLSNIKLYLINAHGEKLIHNNGSSLTPPVILNSEKLVGSDANSTIEPNLLYEPITGTIGDAGYTTPHFFYCYSNETEDMASCTKLVLQCDLDGVTYYYPIPVNQEGYGYDNTRDHIGIRRNTYYSYEITVTRPGGMDPNTPVVPGTVGLSIDVKDWDTVPGFNKEF